MATRDKMNSRSDSRFRYRAGHGLIESPCSPAAAHALRSARRVTVRAMCSSVAPRLPPGSRKLRNVGSPELYASHSLSSRSI